MKPEPRPGGTEDILRRIAVLCEQGDYQNALGLFAEIKEPDADTDNVRLLKASVHLSAGSPEEAERIAVEVGPEKTRALLVLASVEGVRGRTKEQKAFLEKALKNEPENAEVLTALGDLSASAGSFKAAASYYDRALAAENGYAQALLGRAWVYRNAKDPKNAELLLNKAVTLYPSWAVPLQERARLYRALGYPFQALEDIDRALALDKNNYWITADRGKILIDLNRKEEALAEYERAKKMNPGYYLAYVYSAGIKDDLADYEGAYADYAALVKLNPDYYFAFEGLGMHLMRKGDWIGARDAFMEAYKRSRQDTVTYGLLAAVNWMRGGKPNEPKQFLEQVLRKAERDSLEWYVLRLYHDLTGDNDVAIRLDREKNADTKARMLFYLASYYDIRGNKTLADKYFLQVRELERRSIAEWRLNEWTLEARGLAALNPP